MPGRKNSAYIASSPPTTSSNAALGLNPVSSKGFAAIAESEHTPNVASVATTITLAYPEEFLLASFPIQFICLMLRVISYPRQK